MLSQVSLLASKHEKAQKQIIPRTQRDKWFLAKSLKQSQNMTRQ